MHTNTGSNHENITAAACILMQTQSMHAAVTGRSEEYSICCSAGQIPTWMPSLPYGTPYRHDVIPANMAQLQPLQLQYNLTKQTHDLIH
jgi:hypothetical protein